MENEVYQEVATTEYEDDLTFGDTMFLISLLVIACVVVCFVFKQIKKTFKNVNLKIGKVEVGITTKEDEKSDEKKE